MFWAAAGSAEMSSVAAVKAAATVLLLAQCILELLLDQPQSDRRLARLHAI
jgi:hypothetical protein